MKAGPVLLAAAMMCCSTPSRASDFKIGNWNIQTLVYPGDASSVFPDDYRRQAADYADLSRWRDMVGADVLFLQEVTSPAAADAVFPVADGWQHCVSGQYAAAEGLPPGPVCTTSGTTAHKPAGPTRTQYTAVAVKPGSGLQILSVADYSALNVKFLDGSVERDLRWGLDVTLGVGGTAKLRVLDIHAKSGCFDDPVDFKTWMNDPQGHPASRSCDTLGQQMYPLRKWIEAREAAGEAWMIVGDFNRRLDAQPGSRPDEIWTALNGFSANAAGTDRDPRADILLFRQPYALMSVCWREFRNPNPTGIANPDFYNILPIEFFLYGTKAATLVVPESERQYPWPSPVAGDPKRLSDHCPSSMALSVN